MNSGDVILLCLFLLLSALFVVSQSDTWRP